MKITYPPITAKTYHEMLRIWGKIVSYNESGCFYYYHKIDFLRRFSYLQKDESLKKRYFGLTKLSLIDGESMFLEDPDEWNNIFKDLPDGIKSCVFITGIDYLLLEKKQQIFSLIANINVSHPWISILLIFTIDPTYPDFLPLFSHASILYENIVLHPLVEEQDSLVFIRYLLEKWDIPVVLPAKRMLNLSMHCGGHFLLLKEAIRYLRDNPSVTDENLLHHEQMTRRIEAIFTALLPTQQDLLIKIACSKLNEDIKNNHDKAFLLKTKWLKQNNKVIQVAIPLLEEYLQKKHSVIDLKLDVERRIVLRGIPLDGNFSQKELVVLKAILKESNQVISRDQIANLLGGNQNLPTNWAIDKLVSRIRKKLSVLDINPKIITSVYGKGYIYCTGK